MPQPIATPGDDQSQDKGQMIPCALCHSRGPLHYRVRSDVIKDWALICPQCWLRIARQPGYQYGGTRKASRRRRKR